MPFVAMAKARGWSLGRTMLITFLCGLGHVASSVVLGFIGLGFGVAVLHLEGVESFRGEVAGWLLIMFGLVYAVWGVRKALSSRKHAHVHHHGSVAHSHGHGHGGGHSHIHGQESNITPWILFTIFVFGPCEPLIPLLIYPAANGGIALAAMAAFVFSAATVSTMLAIVFAVSVGIANVSARALQPWSHALAGTSIFLCGAGIRLLGL
ncbi:MAG: hypothetical protein V1875_05205 [Candidatus Altiarchaeota archaeon]